MWHINAPMTHNTQQGKSGDIAKYPDTTLKLKQERAVNNEIH